MMPRAWSLTCLAALLLAGAAAAQTPTVALERGAHNGASLLERPARLLVLDATLVAALTRLSETSGVPVAFSPSLIGTDRRPVACAEPGGSADGQGTGRASTSRTPTWPGGSSRIVIRGANSLTGGNQPLFVVDGMPVSNMTGSNPFGSRGYNAIDYGNAIQDINPNDIESLVLKGPNAAALYGSRAANGAIIITTRAAAGRPGPRHRRDGDEHRHDVRDAAQAADLPEPLRPGQRPLPLRGRQGRRHVRRL
jgi:TonB-dependent SusC/RagA subfamily outer membrane receptor